VPHYLWTKEFDATGRITYRYYTPVVERITGRPAEFFMESPDRWISTVHEEDRAHVAASAQRLLERRSGREDARYRIMRPDGGVQWVCDSVTAEPLKNGGVRLCGVVSEAPAAVGALEGALRECDALLAAGVDDDVKAGLHRIRDAIGALSAR
jgi:PAS domain-containing protein